MRLVWEWTQRKTIPFLWIVILRTCVIVPSSVYFIKPADSKWLRDLRARVEKGKQLSEDIQREALARATITVPVPIPKAAHMGPSRSSKERRKISVWNL